MSLCRLENIRSDLHRIISRKKMKICCFSVDKFFFFW